MAVELKFKNNGLSVEDLVDKEKANYGTYDEFLTFQHGETGNPVVIYNPEKLERGFQLLLDDNEICLMQAFPTGESDIRFLYSFGASLLDRLGEETFLRDGKTAHRSDIDKYIGQDKEECEALLKNIRQYGGGQQNFMLTCLRNPMYINLETFESFDGSLNAFSDYLDRLQSQDYHYAEPLLFQDPETGDIMGTYVVVPDVPTVLPDVPNSFNDDFEVDNWNVAFNLDGEDIIESMVSYDAFLEAVDRSKPYDDASFMVKYSEDELKTLIGEAKFSEFMHEGVQISDLEREELTIPQDWEVFFRGISGKPAMIMSNLGLKEIAPVEAANRLVEFAVKFRNSSENGLPDQEEEQTLWDIQKAIEDRIRILNAIYAGCIRWNGALTFFMYTDYAGDFKEDLQEVLEEKYPDYSFEMGVDRDKKWETYAKLLYPDPYEKQHINNEKLCSKLAEEGDSLATARPVYHRAYFSSEEGLKDFVDSVLADGFSEAERDVDKDGELPYYVEITKIHSLGNIDEITWTLMDKAESAGGRYDGWECTLAG